MVNEEERTYLIELGQAFDNIRKQQKLSKEQLAFECGVKESYLRRVLKGETNAGIVFWRRIAKELNTPLSYFVNEVP